MKSEEEKISVVIMTYNAATYLERVLNSVASFDEVLVCDMESTDSTVTIAQKHGCKVITFPKGNHTIAEPARNFADHQAAYPWVLVVDADELVPEALRHYLYSFIKINRSFSGLKIPRKNHFMGHFMHGSYPDHILRFFQRDESYWPPTVHSQPEVKGVVATIPSNRKDLAFIHLDNENITSRLQKINIYTDNELVRKQGKHYSWLAFFYRPLHRFLKSYLFKGGFRDGYPGFIYALLDAFYQVVMLSKLKERHP